MQVRILYFARFREKLGRDDEVFPLPADRDCRVQDVLDALAGRGGEWQAVFGGDNTVMVAINQDLAQPESVLHDADELALFPPVTGG